MIGLIKRRFESTKKRCHGEVHVPVAEMDGGIDEHGSAFRVAKEVARPQRPGGVGPKARLKRFGGEGYISEDPEPTNIVAVEEGGRFGREELGKASKKTFETGQETAGQQAPVGGEFQLRLKTAVTEKRDPAGG